MNAYKHEIAVACMFRNGSFYLREFIEYYKLIGITKFYLGDNMSTDASMEILRPYILSGDVEIEQIEDMIGDKGNDYFEQKIHVPFYARCIAKSIGSVKWLACIDIDEFIVPVQKFTLLEALIPYEAYAGIMLYWVNYGSSGLQKVPVDRLFLEVLTKRMDLTKGDVLGKLIIRPERVHGFGNDPHVVYSIMPYEVVSENFVTNAPVYLSIHPPVDILRINHYNVGDISHFYREKQPFYTKYIALMHGLSSERIDQLLNRIFAYNDVTDFIMERYIPQLRQKILPTQNIEI